MAKIPIRKTNPAITIIDDDKTTVEVISDIVIDVFEKCKIYTAYDGAEAYRIIKQDPPDVIILDAVLPSIDGFSLCQKIKQDETLSSIPVLIMTGIGSHVKNKVKSLNVGAEAFLKKPFETIELVAQLKSLLRLKSAEEELIRQRDLLKSNIDIKDKKLKENYLALKQLFSSFIELTATTIDSLYIYDYYSTQKVAQMVKGFVKHLNADSLNGIFISEEKAENLEIAAWLHDIGKILVPVRLMNKTTRLGDALPVVMQRLETIYYWIQATDAGLMEQYLTLKKLVLKYNNPLENINNDIEDQLRGLAKLEYEDAEGSEKPWLSSYEFECITIQEGSLTVKEKEKVKEHVKLTDFLLSKISFPPRKNMIREWCANHHELLDGSGYWKGLSGNEISIETRILTIVDIFEALTSNDRDYKIPCSKEEALKMLSEMAQQGKLDNRLVNLFKESKVWQI